MRHHDLLIQTLTTFCMLDVWKKVKTYHCFISMFVVMPNKEAMCVYTFLEKDHIHRRIIPLL